MEENKEIQGASWAEGGAENTAENAKPEEKATKEKKTTKKSTTKKSNKKGEEPMKDETAKEVKEEVKPEVKPNPMAQPAPNPMTQGKPNPMAQVAPNPMAQVVKEEVKEEPKETPNPMAQTVSNPMANPMTQSTPNPMAQVAPNPMTQPAQQTSKEEPKAEASNPMTQVPKEEPKAESESQTQSQTSTESGTETPNESNGENQTKPKDEIIALIEAADAEVKEMQNKLKEYKTTIDSKDQPEIQAKYYEIKDMLTKMEPNPLYIPECFEAIKATYAKTEEAFANNWCLEAKDGLKVITNEMKKLALNLKTAKKERTLEIKKIENEKKKNFKELTAEQYAALTEKQQKKYQSDLRKAKAYQEKVALIEEFDKKYRMSNLAGKFQLLEKQVEMSINDIQGDKEFKPLDPKGRKTYIYLRFKESMLYKNGVCVKPEVEEACISLLNKVKEYLTLLGCDVADIVFDSYPDSVSYSLVKVHDFYDKNMTNANPLVEKACLSYGNLYTLMYNYFNPGDQLLMVSDLPIMDMEGADYESIARLLKKFNIQPLLYSRSNLGLFQPKAM